MVEGSWTSRIGHPIFKTKLDLGFPFTKKLEEETVNVLVDDDKDKGKN